MRDKWLAFGCFLTGYNVKIVRSCSEVSIKRVIRDTSALLIICMIWSLVGYLFTARYLEGSWYACMGASMAMIFLVIQVERQILLSPKGKSAMKLFRFFIGIAMAFIGTTIIDQMLFAKDIEKRKISTLNEEVNAVFPGKAQELKRQISELDSSVVSKEAERKQITEDLNRNPYLTIYDHVVNRDTSKKESVTYTSKQVRNPKVLLVESIDKTLASQRVEKETMGRELIKIRTTVEEQLSEKIGFLDELKVMLLLISESNLCLVVWCLWFLLLLCLELFIVTSKFGDQDTDYDRMMEHQMRLHCHKIELMSARTSP